jgi:hypothetical protein
METKPTKPKKPKKVSRDSTHLLIHVYSDKEMVQHLHSVGNVPKDKKKALDLMKDLYTTDLMHGRYYFYELIEQSFKSIDTLPNNK